MRIAIIYIESKHFLSKDIPKNSDFVGLSLAVVVNKEKEAPTIILYL